MMAGGMSTGKSLQAVAVSHVLFSILMLGPGTVH